MSRCFCWRMKVCGTACAVAVAAVVSAVAVAGPIPGEPVSLTQPDGTTFVGQAGGDEWFSWMSYGDALIAQDAAGWWRYAIVRGGVLRPGAARIGLDSPGRGVAGLGDVPGLAAAVKRPPGTVAQPPVDKGRSASEPVLVVLVEFQDRALTTSDAYWSDLFFGTSGKTVRTYYNEVSGGQFDILPAAETAGTASDGIVRVQLQPSDHYSGNHPDPYGTFDDRNRWIVSDALYRTAAYVQYGNYDSQAPLGYITPPELHVVAVVAGYEHGYAGDASPHPAVHGHRWVLEGTVPAPQVGGVYLCGWYGDNRDSGYMQVGELHGDAGGSHAATIGEICHELGHDLGLPDLYDTTFASQGIGGWGLMGYGGWGTAASDTELGQTPVHLCAWSKDQLQLVTPTVATGNQEYTLIGTGTTGYNVVEIPTSDANQRFLIENRQLQGFDAGLWRWFISSTGGTGGGGLAIWHIDGSMPNNDNWSHKMVDLEEANTAALGYGELDTFPANPVPVQANRDQLYYAGHVDLFGDATTPNSRLYNGTPTDINVSSVSISGAVMKCYVATHAIFDLIWSTYFGADSNEMIKGVGVDNTGNVYVCGQACASGVPTTAGAYDTTPNTTAPSFVAKFGSSGALIWSSLLESTGVQGVYAEDVAVTGGGNAFVTGYAGDAFPTTAGAYDTSYNGSGDAFVTKFNTAGSGLSYSTYLGSTGQDRAYGIALDSSACAYVVGESNNSGFPRTTGSAFGGVIDAFVTKFNAGGSALSYSRFLGGSLGDYAFAIAVDSSGRAYVTGDTASSNFPTTANAFDTIYAADDAYFVRLGTTGVALEYSTFLGDNWVEVGSGVAADSSGNGYVTGYTGSSTYPVTVGAYDQFFSGGTCDGFVTKVNPTPSTPLPYSTFLGGGAIEQGVAIVLDGSNNAYIAGHTQSTDFPMRGAYAGTNAGGFDAFVSALDATGATLMQSTYLGGTDDDTVTDLARDSTGALYVVGYTFSDDFPTTVGAYDPYFNGGDVDGFIAKLAIVQATTSLVVGVPDGGEHWGLGRTVTIRWSSSGASSHVDIELCRDITAFPIWWEMLFDDTENDGEQSWTVTGPHGWDCVMRITDSAQSSLTDMGGQFIIAGRGDLNGDTRVNAYDLAIFVGCMAGPGAGCSCNPDDFGNSDLDYDGDVDLEDYAVFQTLAYSGWP